MQHVTLGNTGPEIASELGISHQTVRTHVRNAMTKLEARSRAHLVAKALAEALVEAEGFHDLPAGGMGGVCGACPCLRG